jgi:hypothetical protein
MLTTARHRKTCGMTQDDGGCKTGDEGDTGRPVVRHSTTGDEGCDTQTSDGGLRSRRYREYDPIAYVYIFRCIAKDLGVISKTCIGRWEDLKAKLQITVGW